MSSSTYFNGYNLVVNSVVFEKIHTYNLSLNEFLLLLYYLNVEDKQFNITNLKKCLKMGKADLLSALNGLIEKKLVTLETCKDSNGTIVEHISLANFYKLLDEESCNDDLKKLQTYLMKEYNVKLKASDSEIMAEWLNRGFDFKLIKECIDKSIYNGKFDIRYVDKQLYESKSIKTSDNKTSVKLFDYDWLDDEKK